MNPTDPLASFPPAVRDAHTRWITHRDPAALDAVVLAIVAFHRSPRARLRATDPLPDSARLVEDLGYDSLAIAEVVFFIEDLLQVTVCNADVQGLHTVADLRAHLHARLSPCPSERAGDPMS